MLHFFLNPSDNENDENRRLSGTKLLPNILTIAALCIGLTALRYGVDFMWTNAMMLVLIAAVLDGLDGMVARLLKAQSAFGAELDSFSDFVSFGVVPSVLLYQWNLRDAGPFGWVASLLLCVAMALRLARFNVKNINSTGTTVEPAVPKSFFEGVPAPAGAILALVPMMIGFKVYPDDQDGSLPSFLVAIWVIFIAGLIVSRIPTYSLKRLRLRQKHTIPLLAFVALFASIMAVEPWVTLIICSLGYLASIPHSLKRYNTLYATPQDKQETPVEPTVIIDGELPDSIKPIK